MERMDDPDSDVRRLEATLRQFALVNRFLTRIRYLLRRYVWRVRLSRPALPHADGEVADAAAVVDV